MHHIIDLVTIFGRIIALKWATTEWETFPARWKYHCPRHYNCDNFSCLFIASLIETCCTVFFVNSWKSCKWHLLSSFYLSNTCVCASRENCQERTRMKERGSRKKVPIFISFFSSTSQYAESHKHFGILFLLLVACWPSLLKMKHCLPTSPLMVYSHKYALGENLLFTSICFCYRIISDSNRGLVLAQ